MNKIFKTLLIAALLGNTAFAQTSVKETVPKNWHQLDPATSGYQGISLDKAYDLIKTKNLKSKRVLVAVIDSGIDILHEDLKPILWTNPKEIPGNGIDDDKNGYVDDIHGWNFIGGKDGRNVKEDSYEGARVYYALKAKWDNKEVARGSLSKQEADEYEMFKKAKAAVMGDEDKDSAGADIDLSSLKMLYDGLLKSDSILKLGIGKEIYTGK